MTDVVRRGEDGFAEALEDLRKGYVDAHFPNLGSYAYEADLLTIEEGREIMDDLLSKMVEIDWPDDEHPRFKLKGETKFRHIEDSDDFPQPDTEPFEASAVEADGDGDEEESEEGEEE